MKPINGFSSGHLPRTLRSHFNKSIKSKYTQGLRAPTGPYEQSKTPRLLSSPYKLPPTSQTPRFSRSANRTPVPHPAPQGASGPLRTRVPARPSGSQLSVPRRDLTKSLLNPPHSKSQKFSKRPLPHDIPQSLSSLVTKLTPSNKGDQQYQTHLFQTYQALNFIKRLPPVDQTQLRSKIKNLRKRPGYEDKRTVIFDLDETLVHCCDDTTTNPDVVLPIRFPNGEIALAGVNIRPFAKYCLVEASQLFEVIVFTASHRCYADVVLDYLDPNNELIHHRLYREDCVVMNGVHIKDLRVLGNRRLGDIVIVDNAAYSFAYQLDNGIPIISWTEDLDDKELYNLAEYLKTLSCSTDMLLENRKTFKLRTFHSEYMAKIRNS